MRLGRTAWIAAALALAATSGCLHWWDEVGGYEQVPPGPAGKPVKLHKITCDLTTHTCAPYVGGDWVHVVRWEGPKRDAPYKCPAGDMHVRFRGDAVVSPSFGVISAPLRVVACGYVKTGVCEPLPQAGLLAVCAPRIAGWPPCIAADSPRECPSSYPVQSLVASDTPDPRTRSVCCERVPAPGTASHPTSGIANRQ